jgi:hypothetical protein
MTEVLPRHACLHRSTCRERESTLRRRPPRFRRAARLLAGVPAHAQSTAHEAQPNDAPRGGSAVPISQPWAGSSGQCIRQTSCSHHLVVVVTAQTLGSPRSRTARDRAGALAAKVVLPERQELVLPAIELVASVTGEQVLVEVRRDDLDEIANASHSIDRDRGAPVVAPLVSIDAPDAEP